MVIEKVNEFNLFKEEFEELGQKRKNLNSENKELKKKSTKLTNEYWDILQFEKSI